MPEPNLAQHAASSNASALSLRNMKPRIAFSTLACPQWTWETVIEQARAMGYDGLEWRGGEQGHVNPSWTTSQRAALKRRMDQAQLVSLAVTSYTSFTSDDPRVRALNVESLQQHLELAADIGAPYVRVFLGELAKGQSFESVQSQIIECLSAALPHAHATGVGMAIEHHDDFVRTAALVPFLSALDDPYVGAVWDIANAWSAGESPEAGARNLAGRIAYVQVKDGTGQRPHWQLMPVGAGQVPLARALEQLRAQDYAGGFSVEWEYAWHPELPPPEGALPQALRFLRARWG